MVSYVQDNKLDKALYLCQNAQGIQWKQDSLVEALQLYIIPVTSLCILRGQ